MLLRIRGKKKHSEAKAVGCTGSATQPHRGKVVCTRKKDTKRQTPYQIQQGEFPVRQLQNITDSVASAEESRKTYRPEIQQK